MQQLKIVHIKIPTNQKVVEKNQIVEYENKREGKGHDLAVSRRVYRIQNSDIFYVESEKSNDLYYFVRYNPSVFEWCSCKDYENRTTKCKHIFAIEYAIRLGTLKDIDKLPTEAKKYGSSTVEAIAAKSYRDASYDY